MTPKDLKDWLEPRLDKLVDEIVEIKLTAASQAKDLNYHIHRTNLLEERVEQVADSLKPVESHVQQVRGVGIFIGVVATVVGIIAAVYGFITAS